MSKTLYSLMLSEDVVREVDALAHRRGTSRSNLVNQILAEYVSVTTPEQWVNSIFKAMEGLMQPCRELVPFVDDNAMTMSLKSSLEYKYRPTVKYSVELYRPGESALGQLTVAFRTQSAGLVGKMTEFFRLWKSIEDRNLVPVLGVQPEYALYDGKFLRALVRPQKNISTEQLAESLSDYIRLFDRLMKAYIGGMPPALAEREYIKDLQERSLPV